LKLLETEQEIFCSGGNEYFTDISHQYSRRCSCDFFLMKDLKLEKITSIQFKRKTKNEVVVL